MKKGSKAVISNKKSVTSNIRKKGRSLFSNTKSLTFNKNTTVSSNTEDPDAKAFFDLNTDNDYPAYFRTAWNDRVKAFKANGTWNNLIAVYPFGPSLSSIYEQGRDAKRLSVLISHNSGNVGENSTPYITNNIIFTNEGVNFYEGQTAGTGYLGTGVIPSALMTLNSTAIAIGIPRDEKVSNGYNFGAFESATQAILLQNRNSSNQFIADMYGSTTGTGRILQTSTTGSKGCVLLNRLSSTDYKVTKNNVLIGSNTATQGTLPNIEMYLNRYNGSVTSRNLPISYFCVYGSGLTSGQATQETNDWNTFATAIERNNTYNKNVVIDGNSHTVYYKSAFVRALSYYNGGIGFIAQYHQTGISGQATASCLANAATNIDPLYNSSIATNIYLCWEATNDISTGTALATVQSNYQNLCSGRKAAGFKVLAMPAMCRDFSGDTTKIMNTYYFNEWLAANWATFADDVVDPNDPILGNNFYIKRSNYASDAAYVTAVQALTDNATYFSDGSTHLTLNGYKMWGQVAAQKILTL